MAFNKESNGYVILYTVILTIVCGGLLALASLGLKEQKDKNVKLEQQKNILSTCMELPKTPDEVIALYNQRVQGYVVDAKGNKLEMNVEDVKVNEEYSKKKAVTTERFLPVYEIYEEKVGEGNPQYYVLPVYGFGLWDEIWGYVAIDAKDMDTVKGAVFAQRGETPGLGARISNEDIQKRYKKKKIFAENGELVGVIMQKGEQGDAVYKDAPNKVDGMSGATITGQGVNVMVKEYLKLYKVFIESKKGDNVSLK